MSEPKFITFEEWLMQQATAGDADALPVKCEDCNGDGVVECNLGHEHDCDKCDGEGEHKPSTGDMRKRYNAEIAADAERWSRFHSRRAA